MKVKYIYAVLIGKLEGKMWPTSCRRSRIRLKGILEKYAVKLQTRFIWLQLQSFVTTVRTSGFIGGDSLLTSQSSINLLCGSNIILPRWVIVAMEVNLHAFLITVLDGGEPSV